MRKRPQSQSALAPGQGVLRGRLNGVCCVSYPGVPSRSLLLWGEGLLCLEVVPEGRLPGTPLPHMTFKKCHLIKGCLALGIAKPLPRSGHSLGAPICHQPCQGELAPAPGLARLRVPAGLPGCCPWSLSTPSQSPKGGLRPSQGGRAPAAAWAPPAGPGQHPRSEQEIRTLRSHALSLPNKPNMLTLLIIGEQIFLPNN